MSNVSFVVKNLAGKVIRTGVADENLLEYQKLSPDETVEKCSDSAGEELESDGSEVVVYNHRHPRMVSYPGIAEQLDEMWRVLKENCTLTPSAQLMLDRIEAIKSQFPKDQKYVQRTSGEFVPYDDPK